MTARNECEVTSCHEPAELTVEVVTELRPWALTDLRKRRKVCRNHRGAFGPVRWSSVGASK